METPVWTAKRPLAFSFAGGEGRSTWKGEQDLATENLVSCKETEGSFDWAQFYDHLDVRVVGTFSKGRDGRLSLAVLSSSGSHLYAFVRESDFGQLEDRTRLDDA